MDDLQQGYIQRRALSRTRWSVSWLMAVVLCAPITSIPVIRAQQHSQFSKPLIIPNVRSGRAVLQQHARTTTLLFTPKKGTTEEILLSHPSDYPQGRNAPYAARLIAEVPGQLLIFTDTFASNPGNIQGKCGASPTGERYLHVVSLAAPVRESLAVLIESCLLDIEPEPGTPAFDASTRTLAVRFASENGQPATRIYHIAPDNTVAQ